ncbi:MAG: DUF6160 family protein [Oleispira sp.]
MIYKPSLVCSALLLALPLLAQADLSAMADTDMQLVSGKGIEIDANVDFSQDTTVSYANLAWGTDATDDTYISYRQVIVDSSGNRLTDSDNDGYINVFGGGANVQKSDTLNGYNVVYKNPQEGDYLIRKPAYIMLGEISGGISFTGLKFDFVSDFGYDEAMPLSAENKPRPAMKWTLPDQINFKNFEISGVYVSTDSVIDRTDNKLMGVRLDGPIYMPSATAAYVFVTSD